MVGSSANTIHRTESCSNKKEAHLHTEAGKHPTRPGLPGNSGTCGLENDPVAFPARSTAAQGDQERLQHLSSRGMHRARGRQAHEVLHSQTPQSVRAKHRDHRGAGTPDRLHFIQTAFLSTGLVRCGSCTPGMIMAAEGLLLRHPEPTDEQIAEGSGTTFAGAPGM